MSQSRPRNSSTSSYSSVHGNLNLVTVPTRYFRLAFWTVCLCALVSSAQGQTAEFTQGAMASNTVTLQVPLGGYPGRGVSLPINLNYSSKVWRIGFISSVSVNPIGSQVRNSTAEAIYSEYSTSGWTTSLDVPVIEWPRQNDLFNYTGKAYPLGSGFSQLYRVAHVFIHMPDGSTHELRRADQVYQDPTYVDTSGTYYAVDGSRMRFDSSSTPPTLYLGDGTRYLFNGGTTQYIDRNGNTLTYDASTRQWTDTLGRVIGMPWPANPQAIDYTYSVPGIGTTTISYTLKFRNLSAALTSGLLKPVSDYYLPQPNQPPTAQNGTNFPTATQGGASLFFSEQSDDMDPNSFTWVVGRGQVGSSPFNPVVLAEIDYPNGQSYKFSYNINGELDKVTYPTGGYQRYLYGNIGSVISPAPPYAQEGRGLTSRWLSANGTDEVQWQYQGLTGVTAPGPTGTPDGIHTDTYLYTSGSGSSNNFGYVDARVGMPYDELLPSNMTRPTNLTWESSGPV